MNSDLTKPWARAGLLASSMLLAACGSGSGTIGGNPAGSLQANFDSIQNNVFDALCVGCHLGATAPAGLRLDAANSFALLVGFASVQQPGLLRVDPGNPNASYLIQKLEGTAATGAQMPLNGTPLPTADIAVIRQWITDGAMRSPAPPPVEPIRVTSLSPLPGSVELRLPMSIMAVFDRELDANTVNVMTFVIERSGGDGSFGDGNEVALAPVSVTVPLANPQTAVADLTMSPSAEDTYRVRLVGSGAAVIADLSANALDGEFSGAFPSGDGTAGGDFVAQFTVEGVQSTLQSIQDNVFTPSCAGCHAGGGASLPASLDLTSATASFANLVDVVSVQNAALDRVTAGDADNSYLVQKLEGTQTAGQQMPLGGMPLDQPTIDAIREWIDTGASQ